MRIGRAVFTAAIITSLTLGGGTAWASPNGAAATATKASLPAGWNLTKTKSGFDLSWRPNKPVRIGAAAIEFYAGDRPLGKASTTKDQRTFQVAIDDLTARNLNNLQVRLSGQRIDAAAATPAQPKTATAQPLAAAQLPANPVDPGTPGPYTTITGEYELPDLKLPDFEVPVKMTGYVVAPQGTTGNRPLVLFLHGKHATCYEGRYPSRGPEWPCPSGKSVLPSYRGYAQTQELLASQGYVTVSIAANGIDGQDGNSDDEGAQARSSLVRSHLGHWADWAAEAGRADAPEVVRSAPAPDLTKVLLVGHSRGGEGVNRAAVDSLSPPPAIRDGYQGTVRWQIRGLALIGSAQTSQNPAPDVPSMAILPSCDGDLPDLPGQVYADGTRGVGRGLALHSSVYVIGANHNFFNTEWTPGLSVTRADDDTNPHDPYCGPGAPVRIPAEQQRRVGATYVAAAAAAFVAGDDQVRPLLDGSGVRAPSTDPVTVLSAAVGGNRTPLVVPEASTVVSGAGGRLCAEDKLVLGLPEGEVSCSGAGPHFPAFDVFRPDAGRYAVHLAYTPNDTPVNIRPSTPASLAGADQVALRIAVQTSMSSQFDITLIDAQGRRATLGTATLDALPNPGWKQSFWAREIRMPLTNAAAAGLDLSQIASLEIVARSEEARGRGMLIDAWGWSPGLPAPQTGPLPRIDVGELTVAEGDSGTETYQVPVAVSGGEAAGGKVRVFIADPVTEKTITTDLTVAPGSTTIAIPITVTGNTDAGDSRTYRVGVKAVQGMAVGDAFGELIVQDDDE